MPYRPAEAMMITSSEDILALLDERITEIARSVLDEAFSNATHKVQLPDDASAKLREQLKLINAKDHITVREAALLVSCSESHIRKLVMLARKRRTNRPIPFVDLEGVTVFPLTTLLEWANARPQWQVITNEAT
jgi:hypothetical protein